MALRYNWALLVCVSGNVSDDITTLCWNSAFVIQLCFSFKHAMDRKTCILLSCNHLITTISVPRKLIFILLVCYSNIPLNFPFSRPTIKNNIARNPISYLNNLILPILNSKQQSRQILFLFCSLISTCESPISPPSFDWYSYILTGFVRPTYLSYGWLTLLLSEELF